jgi:single-strand DNA-binding protein
MSKSVNKVLLLGNVGKDPEVHSLRSGIVVNLSLATNEHFKDGRGDWQERVGSGTSKPRCPCQALYPVVDG